MDMYDNDHAHSGGSAEDYQKRQVSYNDATVNLGYDFNILKKQTPTASGDHQGEAGGMSPGHESEGAATATKDGGFNFGSVEERMFVSQYLNGGVDLPTAAPEGKAVTSGSQVFLGS